MGAPAAPGRRWARGAALAALAAGAALAALSAALLAAVLQAEREITVVNGNLHHRGYEDSPSAVLKTLEATREVPLTASTPTAALDAAVSLRLTLEGHELSARVRGFSRAHEAPGGPRLQRAERGFDYGDVTSVHTALGWVYVSPQGINLSREFENHATDGLGVDVGALMAGADGALRLGGILFYSGANPTLVIDAGASVS